MTDPQPTQLTKSGASDQTLCGACLDPIDCAEAASCARAQPPRPPECACFKMFGFPSCYRGHGRCPFLDPGGRGDWRERFKEQIVFYREHEPEVLISAREKRRESAGYVRAQLTLPPTSGDQV